MKQDDRYLTKVERFIKEEEFIMSHNIENDVTERALLYSLQVSIEISMDIVAMKLRDMGLKVDDDATNIEKIESQGIITQGEADFLKEINKEQAIKQLIQLQQLTVKVKEHPKVF